MLPIIKMGVGRTGIRTLGSPVSEKWIMPKEVKMHYITVMDAMVRKIMGIENAAYASNVGIDIPLSEKLKSVYPDYNYVRIEFVSGSYHIVLDGPDLIDPSPQEFIDYIQEFEDSAQLLRTEVEKHIEKDRKQEEEDRIKREVMNQKLLEIYARYE